MHYSSPVTVHKNAMSGAPTVSIMRNPEWYSTVVFLEALRHTPAGNFEILKTLEGYLHCSSDTKQEHVQTERHEKDLSDVSSDYLSHKNFDIDYWWSATY